MRTVRAKGRRDAAAWAAHARPAPAAAGFDWLDPFRLAGQLTEEERMIQEAAHDYCQGQLMPRVLEANRRERFERAILAELLSRMMVLNGHVQVQ